MKTWSTPRQLQLTERYGLDERQSQQFAALLEVLARKPQAPTSVREPDQAVDVHIADSLVALELEAVRKARTLADIGSGAGFPGIALAVALPAAEVSLIEAQSRKCSFLEDAIAKTGMQNVGVVCARAEDWSKGISVHDIVVARAVGPQPVVLEYTAPLLRLGGTLVDWRGRRERVQEEAAERAARELGLERVEIRHTKPYAGARDHHLHVFQKVAETPPRFPRRAGIARKRPLGC